MSIENPLLSGQHPETAARFTLKRRAAGASLGVAVVLLCVKFGAYMLTGSVSLLSSLLDSAFDAVASGITLLSVIHAASPADEDHRFGHGKLEAVAALCQSIFILGSGVALFVVALQRLFMPEPVAVAHIGIAVMLFSVVLTAVLLAYQRHVTDKTKSLAIAADRMHYKGDLGTNIGVIAAIALSSLTGYSFFDPLFALGVSVVLISNCRHIGRQAFDVLLDRELPDDKRAEIAGLVTSHPAVRGMHDLRTRHAGDRDFIELHIEVDADLNIGAVHDIMNDIEKSLFAAFPRAEVLIHPEPVGLVHDHRLDDRIRC